MAIELRFKILKDPWSFGTHFGGFLLSIVGLVLLVLWSVGDGAAKVAAMSVYGFSLVALFGASALYHFLDLGPRGNSILRRIDHAAIYFLIAGSYLPTLLLLLEGTWRIAMIALVTSLAAFGMLFKVLWFRCPEWLSTALYLGLGWVVVIPAYRIFPQLGALQIAWLLAGGLAYSLGALVHLFKRPDPLPLIFGHHEVWHVLVLLGATAHWIFAALLVPLDYAPF